MGERKDDGSRFREIPLDSAGPPLELERPGAPRASAAQPSPPPAPAIPSAPNPPPGLVRTARPVEKTFDAPPVASFGLSPTARILLGLGVAALVAVLASVGLRKRPSAIEETEARGGVYRISDHQLADEFGKDAARAARVYVGHRLQIVGRYAKTRLDFGGRNAVQLAGNGAWLIDAVLRPEVFRTMRPLAGAGLITVECVVQGVAEDRVLTDDCTIDDGTP